MQTENHHQENEPVGEVNPIRGEAQESYDTERAEPGTADEPKLFIEDEAEEEEADEQVSPLTEAIMEEKYHKSETANAVIHIRILVDSLFRTVERMRPLTVFETGRYVSIAATALQSARQFTGAMLREKTSTLAPYTGKEKEITYPGTAYPLPDNLADATGFVRGKIEDAITELLIFMDKYNPVGPKDFVSQNAVLQKLMEAKMMLGEIFGVLAVHNEEQPKAPLTNLMG